MFILSLVLAGLQLGIAGACYQLSGRRDRVVAFVVFAVFMLFVGCRLFLNAPLIFNGLVLSVVGLTASSFNARFRNFALSAVTATATIFLIAMAVAYPAYYRRTQLWAQLREQFPIESLSARLSYERERSDRLGTGSPAAAASADAAPAVAAPPYHARLAELEDVLDPNDFAERLWGRSEALRQIHTTHVQKFIDSPGFGVGRMWRMSDPENRLSPAEIRSTRLARLPQVDFDATPVGSDQEDADQAKLTRAAAPPTPRQLGVLHDEELLDFVNYKGWGYVESVERVAGFQPHHFRRTPVLTAADDVRDAFGFRDFHARDRGTRGGEPRPDESWTVTKLELVSLLKFDEPCVYVSDELPRMDRAAKYDTRPLNSFEQRSLERLEAGEDFVSEQTTNQLVMLGALRAAKPCMRCHSVDRGELLGAFSYVLDRTRPVPPDRNREERALLEYRLPLQLLAGKLVADSPETE